MEHEILYNGRWRSIKEMQTLAYSPDIYALYALAEYYISVFNFDNAIGLYMLGANSNIYECIINTCKYSIIYGRSLRRMKNDNLAKQYFETAFEYAQKAIRLGEDDAVVYLLKARDELNIIE